MDSSVAGSAAGVSAGSAAGVSAGSVAGGAAGGSAGSSAGVAAGVAAGASAGAAVRFAARVFDGVRELVYPRRCPVCDRPVNPAGALICPECEKLLKRTEGPVCRRCGKPLRSPLSVPMHLCHDCRMHPHVYERGCAVFTYHSVAGSLFRFKYKGRQEYGAYFGRCMAEKLAEFAAGPGSRIYRESFAGMPSAGKSTAGQNMAGQNMARQNSAKKISPQIPVRGSARPDFLVPVPVSEDRLRKRGYNQALILAREISRLTGIPVREDVLGRVTDTLPMKNMTPEERQNNLKRAFQSFGNDVSLNSIMLIDDIYTTGATIDACAHALSQKGAERVFFMSLAIGEDAEAGY